MPRNARMRALQLYGRSFYQVRKESGFSEWGFLSKLPLGIDPEYLHDAVIEAPLRWQVLSIAYFRDGEALSRGWCEVITRDAFQARGQALVSVMEEALLSAKGLGSHEQWYDSALIIKPYARHVTYMEPLLKKYLTALGLTDFEVKQYLHGW